MSQTRQNKIVTITNDEVYDLALHQARLADSANVVIRVSSAAERDALTKAAGLTVARLDIPGQPIEIWDGTAWVRQGAKVIPSASSRLGSNLASTAFTTGSLQPIIQAGSIVVTTDVAGYFSYNYPTAFPNGVLSCVLTNGDSAQGRGLIVAVAGSPFNQTLATLFGSVADSSGLRANLTMRADYVVVGW